MEQKDWMELFVEQNCIQKVMEVNKKTEQFGLALTEEDATILMENRKSVLRNQQRVEFGEGILPKLIFTFCDSAYIDQENYVDTIIRLQEMFYLFKNEMLDEISDDELLHFMKEQYEDICFGDLEYLEDTCLHNFAQAIRAGNQDYKKTQGYGAYTRLDEVKRWDDELYLEILKELCWR